MAGRIEARLKELGITLPTAAAPVANYAPFVLERGLVVVSGQLPMHNGKLMFAGKVGVDVTLDEAREAAACCFCNLLAQVKIAAGDLDRVRRVIRLAGYVAAPASFTQHALVMNGASDLAVALFGESGRHARTTIGVASLPADAPVEVEGAFALD